MKWFGRESWGATICDEVPRTEIPVGECCYLCHEPFFADHSGVVMPFYGDADESKEVAAHLRCFARALGIDKSAGDE